MPTRKSSKLVETLMNNVLGQKGESSLSLRERIYAKTQKLVRQNQDELSEEKSVEHYARKVALHAYKITEKDVQQLQTAGYSQAQIFELTATAALSAGKTRLDLVVELLQSEKS